MNMLGLSDFEKIKEDKHTATLRHKDGHEITICIAKLPKIQQEQMKRLKLAKGGVAHYDDGTPDVPVSSDDSQNGSQDETDDQSQPATADHSTNLTINIPQPGLSMPALGSSAGLSAPEAQPTLGSQNSLTSPASSSAQSGPQAGQIPTPATGQVSVPPSTSAVGGNEKQLNLTVPRQAAAVPAQGLDTGIKGANEQQQIDAAKAQAMGPIYQQQSQNAQQIQDEVANNVKTMQGATNSFAQYMQTHDVDPMAFYHDQSVPQKITTAIGLLIGGFTGGFNGTGNNPAMNWLQDQQNKNIQSQLQNINNRKTVLGAYQQMFGDVNTAVPLTRVSMNDKLIAEANTVANNLGTAQAQVNRDRFVSQLQNENSKQLLQSAWIAQGQKYQNQAPAQGAVSGLAAPTQHQPTKNGSQQSSNQMNYGPETADQYGAYNIQPILTPHASSIFSSLSQRAQGGDPVAQAQLAQIKDQYSKAGKADSVLSQAKAIYDSLAKNATWGGWTDRNVSNNVVAGAAGAIPIVGPLIGGLAAGVGSLSGDIVSGGRKLLGKTPGESDFERERDYTAASGKLSHLLKNAYGNAGYAELSNKLSGILPDKTDTPANITTKMKSFEDLIKSSLELNLLQNNKMAH